MSESYREVRREYPVVGEYRYAIIQADDLCWLVEDHESGNDGLAVHHEFAAADGTSVHDFICSHFRPGLTFLDVGAHGGHYALRAASAGCKVIAVEANPETAGLLRFNRDLNQLDFDIWALAAWDKRDLLTITVPVNGMLRNAEASVAATDPGRPALSILVPAWPLDDIPRPRIDLVKLDVEGADMHVIDGMMRLLTTDRPVIIWEGHTQYGSYTAADAQERMDMLSEAAGYQWADMAALGVTVPPGAYAVGRCAE